MDSIHAWSDFLFSREARRIVARLANNVKYISRILLEEIKRLSYSLSLCFDRMSTVDILIQGDRDPCIALMQWQPIFFGDEAVHVRGGGGRSLPFF